MRIVRVGRRLPFAVATVAACVAGVGCGTSTPATPSVVQISLTAPVDGARVDVRNLLVFGTVNPQYAKVKVLGRVVRVNNGAFRRWVALRPGVTNIGVSAAAPGFVSSALKVSVRTVNRRIPIPHSPRSALQEFLNRANQACSQTVTQDLGFAFKHLDQGYNESVGVAFARKVVGDFGRLLGQLGRIKAPAPQAQGYQKMISDFSSAVSQLNGAVGAATSGQLSTANVLFSQANATVGQAVADADALELYLCGSGLGNPH